MLQALLARRSSIYLLSILVGLVAGAGAIGFEYLSGIVVHWALVLGAGYSPTGPSGEVQIFGHGGG